MWNRAILACFLAVSLLGWGQIETGTWRMHTATMRALDITTDNTTVFVAYENGLLRVEQSHFSVFSSSFAVGMGSN